MTFKSLHLAPILLALVAAPAFADTYRYSGTVQGEGACVGEVTFNESGGEVHVRQTIRIGSNQIGLSGVGKRYGNRVLATLATHQGISQRLRALPRGSAPKSMVLTFDLAADGTVWNVRGSIDAAIWLRGWGKERAVEPTRLTSDALSHRLVKGVHFLKGGGDKREIEKEDVAQGQLGDCYFLAALAAVADSQPNHLRARLRAVSPNESEVYLNRRWIPVSHKLAMGAYGRSYAGSDTVYQDGALVHELWPALYEKALVINGGGYSKVEGGAVWTGVKLLGYNTKTILPLVNTNWLMKRALRGALAAKQPITIAFPPAIDRTSTGKRTRIVGAHVYAITGERNGKFVLFNPWGSQHPEPLSPGDMRKLLSIITIGR